MDYLLKPFDRQRFEKALSWAKEQLRRGTRAEASDQLLALRRESQAGRGPADRVLIKTPGRLYFVKTDAIDWIEAAGNYLRLHSGGETHLLRETMNNFERRLEPTRFVRIHRSTIVNVERIRELQTLFHGDYVVLLRDGTELTLSRNYLHSAEASADLAQVGAKRAQLTVPASEPVSLEAPQPLREAAVTPAARARLSA